jgi:hypothetical protein
MRGCEEEFEIGIHSDGMERDKLRRRSEETIVLLVSKLRVARGVFGIVKSRNMMIPRRP